MQLQRITTTYDIRTSDIIEQFVKPPARQRLLTWKLECEGISNVHAQHECRNSDQVHPRGPIGIANRDTVVCGSRFTVGGAGRCAPVYECRFNVHRFIRESTLTRASKSKHRIRHSCQPEESNLTPSSAKDSARAAYRYTRSNLYGLVCPLL